jgi:hypothetical protein
MSANGRAGRPTRPAPNPVAATATTDRAYDTRPTRRCDVCDRQHRRWHTQAKCCWPRAIWVAGDGRWATVAYCVARRAWKPYFGRAYRDSQTVMLHATR